MKLSKSFQILLFIAILINCPTNAGESSTGILGNCAKYLSFAGLAGAVSWVGYKLCFQNKKRAQIDDDAVLKGRLDKKVGSQITEKIAKIALKERELLAYEDREQLLAAVTPGFHRWRSEFYEARANAFEALDRMSEDSKKAFNALGGVPIVAIIFCSDNRPNAIKTDWLVSHQKESFFIKNQTNPRTILGNPIKPGECAFIIFSDRDMQIHLHESDRRTLINLSHEQRGLIKAFYKGLRELNEDNTKIFLSLSPEVRASLRGNYNLEFPQKWWKKYLNEYEIADKAAKSLAFGGVLFGLLRAGQSNEDPEKFIRVIGTLASLFGYYITSDDLKLKQDSWLIPLCTQLFLETFYSGPKIVNYLMKN